MAVSDNPVLGKYMCPCCNESSEVLQARRGAGRFLYRRGCGCKTDQRSGAKVQTLWWNNTEWFDGEPDVKPPNVLDSLGSESELITEKEPEREPVIEPETTEKSEGKGGLLWLAGGILTVVALVIRGR